MNGSAYPRKTRIKDLWDRLALDRDKWLGKNRYFHEQDLRYMQFLIPEGQSILELGCGDGRLLNALKPSKGVGIDISPKMAELAKNKYPSLEIHTGDVEDPELLLAIKGQFDVIILSDTIGYLEDCQATLDALHTFCTPDTRIVIAYYNHLWEPLLRIADVLGLKARQRDLNWLSTDDIANLLHLADFELIRRDWRQLIPRSLLGLGVLINRYIAPLPLIRQFCVRTFEIARSRRVAIRDAPSVSVIIPCRNEKGNIEPAIKRMPQFCEKLEIVFVEGHSSDGTWEEVQRVRDAYPKKDIKCLQQDGVGKGDAVRLGFDAADNDVLMILDADLTVRPGDLPKFYEAVVSGKGEFIIGSRLVYPMEDGAMRFLNHIANQFFASMFSFLLNQRFTDTLCGTKVLRKDAYRKIVENRHYFGDFDPFGDFDLIFGAAKLNLKILEVPVRYASRAYGETQISRFSHGWLLLRMVFFAFRKLKAF